MKTKLPALRERRGWTQADVADLVGTSRQTIISIEKGKYDPSLPMAFRLAHLFDMKIEELFLYEPDA